MKIAVATLAAILTSLLLAPPGAAKFGGWHRVHHKAKSVGLLQHPWRDYRKGHRYHWVIRRYAGSCLSWIIDHENTRWIPERWNTAGSGAYGLPQALPSTKMSSAGQDWRHNPFTQVRWMRGYTTQRYGSPCAALAYWRSHSVY